MIRCGRIAVMALALLSLAQGHASESPNSGSRRFGSKVIQPGDSVQRLIEAAGQPERRVPIHNKFGAVIAVDYYYTEGRFTVVVHTDPDTLEVNWIEER